MGRCGGRCRRKQICRPAAHANDDDNVTFNGIPNGNGNSKVNQNSIGYSHVIDNGYANNDDDSKDNGSVNYNDNDNWNDNDDGNDNGNNIDNDNYHANLNVSFFVILMLIPMIMLMSILMITSMLMIKSTKLPSKKHEDLEPILEGFWTILASFLESFWGPGGSPRASSKGRRLFIDFWSFLEASWGSWGPCCAKVGPLNFPKLLFPIF